ncbi:chromate efflux transporter [Amorphus orientalis]|uniref:Chromate transporter n=1 Tax=Amorphus orientalis TaxID=649198 RepID=A0AAE3VLA8_9HYPH|nr:chromate efflux transporter [Amorphus orientalis]MDQ0313998.1 chromate transporter [Amorphus orientalis]
MQDRPETETDVVASGSAAEVFRVFLVLGLTSFGGPIAHLGYFRSAVVERRKWLSEAAYADLIALCQFLPGPASSQVGMGIGLKRAGYLGMAAAWTAFTLPSAIALVVFAYGLTALGDTEGAGWIAGLKAAAVAVVAQALLGMAGSLAPDARRATIAAAAMIALLILPTTWAQVLVIALGAAIGLVVLPRPEDGAGEGGLDVKVSRPVALTALAVFFVLLAGLPLAAAISDSFALTILDTFYRAGSLVFGGGHVVLPLLEQSVVGPGLVPDSAFLAGYGAAQAVPGPLFTFAAFLGAVLNGPVSGIAGAVLALLAIFLPSALLVIGTLPFWAALRHRPNARRALMGVNAAVIGLLAAALYDPVFTRGITSPMALAIAVAAYVALSQWKAPPWAVVVASGVVGGVVL